MNFYNPYYFPYTNVGARTGLFSGLLQRLNFNSIINGAQRTLNTVNQIIPLVRQAKPMMDNAKTMFKLMSEFNRNDEQSKNITNNKKENKNTASTETVLKSYDNGPTFFQ